MILFRESGFNEENVVQNFLFQNHNLDFYEKSELKLLKILKSKVQVQASEKNFFDLLYKVKLRIKKIPITFEIGNEIFSIEDENFVDVENFNGTTAVVLQTLNQLRPLVGFTIKKISGVKQKIPFFSFESSKDCFQTVHWLYKGSRKQMKFRSHQEKLAEEISIAFNFRGYASFLRYEHHNAVLAARPLLKHLKKR